MADIIYMRWEDAFTPGGGWQDKDDVDAASKRRFLVDTVGILLRCENDGVVIASGWTAQGEEHTYQNVLKVPSGWIHDIRKMGTVSSKGHSTVSYDDLVKVSAKWRLKLGEKNAKK